MAIWVCRTGPHGEYEDSIFQNNQIYMTRLGFNYSLMQCDKESIISAIAQMNDGSSRQTISNIWSQIDIFSNRMKIGDVVVIPKKGKYEISIARITGQYEYDSIAPGMFQHKRNINIIATKIDTNSFPRDIFYSLGAFRAIFSIQQEERFIKELRKKGIDVGGTI